MPLNYCRRILATRNDFLYDIPSEESRFLEREGTIDSATAIDDPIMTKGWLASEKNHETTFY